MKVACLLAVSVAAAAVAWPYQTALACFCDNSDERTFPADGATSVPTNVLPTVYTAYPSGGELWLRRASDERVVFSYTTTRRRQSLGVPEATLTIVHPDGPLDAMTDYELVDGYRVLASFRTGSAADDQPPASPPLSHLRIETMQLDPDGASCGRAARRLACVPIIRAWPPPAPMCSSSCAPSRTPAGPRTGYC